MREDAYPHSMTATSKLGIGPAVAGHLPGRKGLREITYGASAGAVKWLEECLSAQVRLFRWYGDFFYGKVLDRELGMIEIGPGARVLHIGMGALPYTACYLARRGFRVDAVDHDGRVLAPARHLVRASGVADQVTVIKQDGLQVDPAPYDAIWISLHVCRKQETLERLVRNAGPDCWIVYREPRGWLRRLYPSAGRSVVGLAAERRVAVHRLSKESVALHVSGGVKDERSS